MLDLRQAHLQVQVSKSFWLFQTVRFASRKYCLTKLDFGLNVALKIMKVIISADVVSGREGKRGHVRIPWWHLYIKYLGETNIIRKVPHDHKKHYKIIVLPLPSPIGFFVQSSHSALCHWSVRVPAMGQWDVFENYLYSNLGKNPPNSLRTNYTKKCKYWMYIERNSLTSRYKITLDELTCH